MGDPFQVDGTGWANIGLQKGVRGFPWHDVSRVGIAISPDCWSCEGRIYRGVLADLVGVKTFEEALKLTGFSRRGWQRRTAS